MKFYADIEYNNNWISIIHTNDITSEGNAIFKYSIFSKNGQLLNVGEVAALTMNEAIERLTNK